MFEIPWFWAKDSKGLERLSQADMLALGLQELRSKICISDTWEVEAPIWDQLRVLHEIFGFAADSVDIPHFLGFPVASLEWDGTRVSFVCDVSY